MGCNVEKLSRADNTNHYIDHQNKLIGDENPLDKICSFKKKKCRKKNRKISKRIHK